MSAITNLHQALTPYFTRYPTARIEVRSFALEGEKQESAIISSSRIRPNPTCSLIPHLNSEADIILIAYGSANGGSKQEAPPYIFELADQNRTKKIELLHYDGCYEEDIRKWYQNSSHERAPWCVKSGEWNYVFADDDYFVFEHAKYSNVRIKIMGRSLEGHPAAKKQLSDFVSSKLSEGKRILFGVHNNCYFEDQTAVSPVYNEFCEKYRGKIHLIIQGADQLAFIYSGKHHNIMGLFALNLHWKNPGWFKWNWSAFVRTFSEDNPSSGDVAKVRSLMDQFLSGLESPEPILYQYLDDKNNYSLRIMDIEKISASIFEDSNS